MVCYSNSTTEKLEAFGRARGLDGFGVLKSPQNSAGVFFVVQLNGETPVPLDQLGLDCGRRKAGH